MPTNPVYQRDAASVEADGERSLYAAVDRANIATSLRYARERLSFLSAELEHAQRELRGSMHAAVASAHRGLAFAHRERAELLGDVVSYLRLRLDDSAKLVARLERLAAERGAL